MASVVTLYGLERPSMIRVANVSVVNSENSTLLPPRSTFVSVKD